MMRLLHGAWVIARRDFAATVLSKAFIFFLLGPLFPLLLGGVFGTIGAHVADRAERATVAVISTQAEFTRYSQARNRLAEALGPQQLVTLIYVPPEQHYGPADPQRVLKQSRPPLQAVLYGPFDNPRIAGNLSPSDPLMNQLRLIVQTAQAEAAPTPALPITKVATPSGTIAKDRSLTAQIGQMLLFFLTILLSGMLLSQLIEEKSNKIIEVIAAAVPIDSMFIGKLFAMLAASVVGLIVWIGAGAVIVQFVKQGGVASLPPPAVGWPEFLVLGIIYFAMNYLLLGSLFLMIGAQASTVREVQTLSMPATFGQVLIFGLASLAIGAPNSPQAIGAALFPLSSPLVMLARAAEEPELWPHLIAILWQVIWVGLILRFGAQLFRRTVLKSGPRTRWWSRKAVT